MAQNNKAVQTPKATPAGSFSMRMGSTTYIIGVHFSAESKLPGFLKLKDPHILSLKMFPVCYRMTKAGRFAPSSVRFLNWGIMSNGKCLTARISESPKQESGCILSDILISDVPEKYYLNQKQMEQLLFKSGQEVREKESTVQKD